MGTKRNVKTVAAATDTNDDAVAAALAMIDAELHGEQEIADAVAASSESEEIAPAAATEEESMEGLEPDDADISAALAEIEADAAASAPPTSTKKPKKSSTSKAAPVPTRAFTDVAAIDKGQLDSNLNALNAKKVIEKAQNVIQAVETGKKLSRYTADAVKALKARGNISAKTLVETFRSAGLSDGTARAQSQQMTALFKALGMVVPDATNTRELVIADAGLVDELVQLSA